MAYQIGTDEAGYGPNLGPLVICGSRWEVPRTDVELYELLSNSVVAKTGDAERIAICDSKALYKSGGSIEALETSVLSLIYAATGQMPRDLVQLEKLLHCQIDFSPTDQFKVFKAEIQLPRKACQEHIRDLGNKFAADCQRMSVELQVIACRAIFPQRFNELIERLGNKAEMLSTQSIQIVGELLDKCDSDCRLVCDKHGGRSKYLGIINQVLTNAYVTVELEQQRLSQYRWRLDDHEIELNFQMGGESFLPTALSSMVAKYIRELTMLVWNHFWAEAVPGIKPTKGYPVDAKRFRREIEVARKKLRIPEVSIWRCR